MDRRSAADELGVTSGDQVVLADLGDERGPVPTRIEIGRRTP
jgi:hypothetical protein